MRADPDAEYFLGSLVIQTAMQVQGNIKFEECELLDGQQRMTTLLLLMACIRDAIGTSDEDVLTLTKEHIIQEENKYKKQPKRLRIVFEIRDEVASFIDDYVVAEGGTSRTEDLKGFVADKNKNVSIRNMANALLVIRELLEENKQEISDFFLYLNTQVLLMSVETDNQQDAFRLFTVMNDRGIKLRNSDILKATNLREVTDDALRSKWAKRWEEMESYFDDDFDKFITYIHTILVKKKAKATLIEEFEESIYSNKVYDRSAKTYIHQDPLLEKGIATFEFIDSLYTTYQRVFDAPHIDEDKKGQSRLASNTLTIMEAGLAADYWVAPVLAYYKRFGEKGFSDFLSLLDRKVSGDWMCGISVAKRIENVNDILKGLESAESPSELLSMDVFVVNAEEIRGIVGGDIYGKRYARYLMLKLELAYHDNDEEYHLPATISIEHVLPQNPPNDSDWRALFSDEERSGVQDKIGNLVLLSRRKNSSLGNRPYAAKKAKYFEKNIGYFPHSMYLCHTYDEWTPKTFEENQKAVVSKLMQSYE